MPPKARDPASYLNGNRPAPGVFAAVLKEREDDPDATVLMTRLDDILRCMKHEKNLTANQMKRLSGKAVFDWFENRDGYVLVQHDHFDPVPTSKDVRAAIKKLYGSARKPYEPNRPKRLFTKKRKSAQAPRPARINPVASVLTSVGTSRPCSHRINPDLR